MSNESNPFEKYVVEKKGVTHLLKQSKTWVIFATVVACIIAVYFLYRYLALERMSAKEVAKSIEIVELDTKWIEKDVTPHSIKIVPTVTFKFKNVGKRPLQYVNFEGVFEFADSGRVHTDGVASSCQQPLLPGQVSEEVFIKAFFGYSATSKQAFLQHIEEWQKMNVKLFAITRGSGPVPIAKYPVKQVIEGLEEQTDQAKAELKEDVQTVTRAIQVAEHDSIWLDRKVTTGKTIIVPSITIKLKNIAKEPIRYVYLKGVFEFVDNGERLTQGLAAALDDALQPGETSEEILIKGEFGYEASSKGAFFDNISEWRSVQAKIFAKMKDTNYVLIGTYPIKKEIEGIKLRYRIQQKDQE